MTRKDYVLLAEYLQIAERNVSLHSFYGSLREWETAQLAVAVMVGAVADALAGDNSAFNRVRFMEAARLPGAEARKSFALQVAADEVRIGRVGDTEGRGA